MAQTSWVGPVAAQPKWLGLVQPNKKKREKVIGPPIDPT